MTNSNRKPPIKLLLELDQHYNGKIVQIFCKPNSFFAIGLFWILVINLRVIHGLGGVVLIYGYNVIFIGRHCSVCLVFFPTAKTCIDYNVFQSSTIIAIKLKILALITTYTYWPAKSEPLENLNNYDSFYFKKT